MLWLLQLTFVCVIAGLGLPGAIFLSVGAGSAVRAFSISSGINSLCNEVGNGLVLSMSLSLDFKSGSGLPCSVVKLGENLDYTSRVIRMFSSSLIICSYFFQS